MLRRSILLTLAATLAMAVLASPSASARPDHPLSPCSSPTLTGPTTVQVGETWVVDGCGFAPGAWVPIDITEAGGCCLARNVLADEDGRFSVSGAAMAAGAYRVRAGQTRQNGRTFVAAEWHFKAE